MSGAAGGGSPTPADAIDHAEKRAMRYLWLAAASDRNWPWRIRGDWGTADSKSADSTPLPGCCEHNAPTAKVAAASLHSGSRYSDGPHGVDQHRT